MTSYPHLVSPFQLRGVTLRNRTVMPPMSTQLGSPEGLVTPQQIAFYRARAVGGVGLLIVEFCCVHRASGQSEPNQLALEAPDHVPGQRDLVRAIRDAGAVPCLQLQHGGGGAKRSLLQVDVPWGPSDVVSRRDPSKITTRAMTAADAAFIVECFGRSAKLGVEAGYEAVELHGAHGYLLTQFISPMTNHRTDELGGTEERRIELPRRVIQRVREAIGDRPLIYRLSADEFSPKGLSIDDMVRIAPKLVEAGVDAIHVSIGVGSTSFDKVVEPMSMPEGWRLPYARRIRDAVKVPVIAVGQIRRPETAEKALADGDADLIALGRTLLADPDWPNKAAAGKDADIIPCTSCNFCVSNGFAHRSIACADNPRTGRELDVLPATVPGRRAVVLGGGPGGMVAALHLERAGFETTLYEARASLGGGLIASAAPPKKDMIDRYRAYLDRQLQKSKVRLLLGTAADAATVIAARPEIVMIATGATTTMPDVEGLGHARVVDAYAMLMGDLPPLSRPEADPIVVYGGGETGCETAEYFLERGYRVVLVTRSPRAHLARAAESIYRANLIERLERNPNLRIMQDTTISKVNDDGVHTHTTNGPNGTIHAQYLVIAQGRRTDPALENALTAAGIESFVLGDARRGGRIGDAVRDAYDAVKDACS